ncbi:hypothetical protein [Pseudomonas sp. 25 R 14]|uniref:hypothetical protein n=1 Tax=Pseudomonas sp. 25 R 14 TaxID=1844109 RepID=UPI000812991D|nr:hypothetical protein [Pseudomonas sp. 25 R 14]CRM57084.1 hypothetical protein [Pseudomonas sp. 25 R 14]
MNASYLLMLGTLGLTLSPLIYATSEADAEEKSQLRKLLCESKGGADVTAQGELKKGDEVGAVVVCRLPPSPTTVVENQAVSTRALLPLTPITAALSPPSGVYKLDPGAASVNTSCSANIAIAKWAGFPDTSNGNATLNCRGYNAGPAESSLGCRVEWTGPAQIAVGAIPYGGQVMVNFTCLARQYGVIGTVIEFSYADPLYSRIRYGSTRATASMTITQ